MAAIHSRREFLGLISGAGAGLALGPAAHAEPPPETTTIRLAMPAAACLAPLTVAEDLLHEEGFAEVRYVASSLAGTANVADGIVDIDFQSWADFLPLVDAGRPVTVLAGVHVGCIELRANDSVGSIAELRRKRVGVGALGGTDHMLVSLMAAYVGLKPASDIDWVVNPSASQAELFAAGKVDAFIGFPPGLGQPCPRDAGHVIVNLAHDPPWSHYFCCMVVVNGGFMRDNPVATKRALRAILKATDICHREPERVARRMADIGLSYDCALMTLKDANFGVWREYDPEDTVRFYALRTQELGFFTSAPNEIVARGTDWRFLDELRRELKT
jgi:NitT/TauT family transport system substrate-binding protein